MSSIARPRQAIRRPAALRTSQPIAERTGFHALVVSAAVVASALSTAVGPALVPNASPPAVTLDDQGDAFSTAGLHLGRILSEAHEASIVALSAGDAVPLGESAAGSRWQADRFGTDEEWLVDEWDAAEDAHRATDTVTRVALAARPLFAFRWPVAGEITSHFGEVGPTSPHGHAGLDIAQDWGTPVLAAEEGRVVATLALNRGYGWHVIVDHGNGVSTLYGHLSDFAVEEGQWVGRGQVIGAVGDTGYSFGPHLHFEIRRDGKLTDPLDLLPSPS